MTDSVVGSSAWFGSVVLFLFINFDQSLDGEIHDLFLSGIINSSKHEFIHQIRPSPKIR